MRLRRLLGMVTVMCITIGFSGSYASALQCDYVENSQSVYEDLYGYYCMGTGPGCGYCWEEIVIQG